MYPFNLQLDGVDVLFVGAGAVATRRIGELLSRSRPNITVVAPIVSAEIEELARTYSSVRLVKRPFELADLEDNYRIAIACTSDKVLNADVGRRARERGTWVNVASDRALSTLHFPAVADVDGVLVAVSTGAVSPKLAKAVKDAISEETKKNKK
ncbi:hypothetical protein RsTz2092_12180 [Deferribacterales bacterium RsTz2092]|nr:hypothetical protein AGMMS49941_11050 [Deferribacterales bacterium]